MEKFQIAKYGMMQVTALVYGILASGTAVKFNKGFAEQGFPMTDGYYHALFFRDYGIWLMIFVLAWVVAVSYLSSPFAKWEFDGDDLANTGLVFAIILMILGSVIAVGGVMPPAHVLTGVPLK